MENGNRVSKNFAVKKQIKSLDEFWEVLNSDKSIYWRHRIFPTAFFMSWTIRTIKTAIDLKLFWSIEKINNT